MRLFCIGLTAGMLFVCPAYSQQVTGSVVGTTIDSSGALVPEVPLKLIHEATGVARQTETDPQGNFVFAALPPGVYRLEIERTGFKKYERRNINLTPNERLTLGQIRLDLGAVTETVSVTAEGATVQTVSAERSGTITSSQVENLTVINRDFSVLMGLLPGVVANRRGETLGFGSNATFNVQGTRNTGNNITIDGLPAADLGNAFSVTAFANMDSVSEVKILVSNFQAEFGRKAGAAVQAVTKSGSREFHGAAYWYNRHEQYNANNFFNNRNGVPEPRYRYTTAGYHLGGPLYVPGKFNANRQKLFFFFSNEHLREQRPQPIRQLTMPTAAERAGDFSDARELNGTLIVVRDPTANGGAFPGNRIPANRLHTFGQRYLDLLPRPNFFDIGISARRYNYQFQESLEAPKHNEILRIDYNLRPRTLIYGRFTNWWEDVRGNAAPGQNTNWGWLPNRFTNTSKSAVISLTEILSPTLVLEAVTGVSRHTEKGRALNQEDVERLKRTVSRVLIPQFHPENNPLNLVPKATFGGITGTAGSNYENRFPLRGSDTLFTWSGAVTKTAGPHSLKFGAWVERSRNFEGEDGNFAGLFSFNRDVNNPNDTNHPYANALLGYFQSYSESTTRPPEQTRSTLVEWFAQDNWKLSRKLTLDFGVRFGWAQPYHNYRRQEAGFVASRFDPARQVRLVEPDRVGNRRVGRHPVTGETLPSPTIGAIAPGVGDPYNGTVNTAVDLDYPGGLRESSSLKIAPRFGWAYDPFGKGKTAVRGGIGVFYEMRERGNRGFGVWSNPPIREDPVISYGHLDTFIQSQGVTFPSQTSGFQRDWPVSRIINYSFGIQQEVGFATLMDVSYAGSLGRHLIQTLNQNAIPFGANFQPANGDPTNPGRPLPAAFLRPYLGYNDILLYEFGSNSNYHSLQFAANRRFAGGLQFGGAWTWSKAMDYVDADTSQVSTLINPRVWNYGRAGFDRTHILTLNWTWEIPKASRAWNHLLSRAVLDNWQLSGIASFQSGAPLGIGLSFVQAVDITGSPTDGARVVLVQNPVIPKSERTFSRNFNTNAFKPPAVGTFGNAAKDLIRGPGQNNWDLSLFKNIPLRERLRLQFRAEFYNAFNHTQFGSLDTAARFDAQGRQVNTRFGEYTNAGDARRIQFALRLSF